MLIFEGGLEYANRLHPYGVGKTEMLKVLKSVKKDSVCSLAPYNPPKLLCGAVCNFATAISHNGDGPTPSNSNTQTHMAQSTNTPVAAKAAKTTVSNPKAQKSVRLLETRDDWSRIEAEAVKVLTLTLKGENLGETPSKAFGFGGAEQHPHTKSYALSLFAGFATKKAAKVLKGLYSQAELRQAALAAYLAVFPKGTEAVFSKAETKRERYIAEAVAEALGYAKNEAEEVEATPKGVEASEPKADQVAATPKGGKAKKSKAAKKTA